jgi:hypothetical protein
MGDRMPAKSKKRAGRATRAKAGTGRPPGGAASKGRHARSSAGKNAAGRRPGTVLALIVLTFIQALGAIGGGIGLVRDPVNNIGMSTSLLEGTPFNDYLIPGLILLIVVGLFSLAVFAGLLRDWKPVWWLSLASGGGLVIWIIAEVALLGNLGVSGITMQVLFGLVGAAIVVLALLPATRRYFGIGHTRTASAALARH